MTNKNIILTILIIIAIAIVGYFLTQLKTDSVTINSFDDCLKAGLPILESHPRKCLNTNGQTFTETVDTTPSNQPVILNNLKSGDTISSPITITGQARGWWFFEASFPILITDDQGNALTTGIAQAQSDWMTTELVPFKVTLNFNTPTTDTGFIIFKKDNPSGLVENDAEIKIPVKFSNSNINQPIVTKPACVIFGCSRQLCGEVANEMVTTCEFRAEYACYKTATCGRDKAGQCAWLETPSLKACLKNPPALN